MKKKEYKTINIQVFRTPEGLPTCTIAPGKDCDFLRSNSFGVGFYCTYSGDKLQRYTPMGFLKPASSCPIRSNKK